MRTVSNRPGIALALILALAGAPPLGAGAAQGGTIAVSTEPAGAAVFLDGQAKGVTPLSIADVPAGEHRVRLVKHGFVENSRVVSVPVGGRETVALRMTQAPAPSPAPDAQDGGEGWTTTKKALVGGGAVAALLGVILIAGGGSSEPDNAAPTPGSIGISPAGTGIAGITTYTFTAQGATDPENAPLTYSWNFGDGTSGSGPTASHIFPNGGNFTVTLNVSDGAKSASATTTLGVGDVVGTWVNIDPEPGFPGGIERRIRFTAQAGTNISGTYRISTAPGTIGSVTGTLSPPRNITFEAKLKDSTGKSLGFTFTMGTLKDDLSAFSGIGKGYLLRNDTLLFGREDE